MYFITTKRMLEVCFSAHPNIQYRTKKTKRIIQTSFVHNGTVRWWSAPELSFRQAAT